jgi:hypothetical protein
MVRRTTPMEYPSQAGKLTGLSVLRVLLDLRHRHPQLSWRPCEHYTSFEQENT